MAGPTVEGRGIRASRMAEGRCVKTIVCIRPIRRATDAATRLEVAAIRLVTEKREPRRPGSRRNFWEKKYVTQDLYDGQYRTWIAIAR